MCNSIGCGMWEKVELLEGAIAEASPVHIPVPDGYFLHEISVVQGSTNIGASCTLTFVSPGRANEDVLALAAGVANGTKNYPVRIPAVNNTGGVISGYVGPVALNRGGINMYTGGTYASGGTATITVRAAEYPPAI